MSRYPEENIAWLSIVNYNIELFIALNGINVNCDSSTSTPITDESNGILNFLAFKGILVGNILPF